MREHELPTIDEIFTGTEAELRKAYKALGDAADWMRSDWRPVGSALTSTQAAARSTVFNKIGAAKRAINAAHDAIGDARRSPSTKDGVR